jgi:predicted nucleic acid-binding protein
MASRTGRPLTRPSAFWDTSALIPLYVREENTAQASGWYKEYEVVIWWGTPVEIAGALARLLRIKSLDTGQWREAVESIAEEAEMWSVVEPSDELRAHAIEIVKRYDLRAGDALQLAAALEWCDEVPGGRRFLTADERLRNAAVLCGFDA